MTTEEIDARLPSRLHPYLKAKLAYRLLRPVQLDSPEFHFATSLLYVVDAALESYGTRWPDIVIEEAANIDPAFRKRCQRVIQHIIANLQRRTTRLLASLGEADSVLHSLENDS